MRNFLKIALVLSLLIFQHSCGNTKKLPTQSMYGYEKIMTKTQIDSVCVADTLNPNLNEWINTYFVDYETNEKIIKMMYYKNDGAVVYTLTPKDTLFLINKRWIK